MLSVVEKWQDHLRQQRAAERGEWINLERHKTFTENILPQVTSHLRKLLAESYNA